MEHCPLPSSPLGHRFHPKTRCRKNVWLKVPTSAFFSNSKAAVESPGHARWLGWHHEKCRLRKLPYVWWWLGTCYEKPYLKPFCLVMSLFKPLGDFISLGLTKPPNIQVLKVLFVYHKIHPKGFGTSGLITFLDHSANNNPCFSAKKKRTTLQANIRSPPFPRHCTLQLLQETTLGEAETEFCKIAGRSRKDRTGALGTFFFAELLVSRGDAGCSDPETPLSWFNSAFGHPES